jgi:malate synthase
MLRETQNDDDRRALPNTAPASYDLDGDPDFAAFYRYLHALFTPRQRALRAQRAYVLERAHAGHLPDHLPPSVATTSDWNVSLPAWCADQRNLMSVPADDLPLVTKALGSRAPVVLLDLEDALANTWPNLERGTANIIAALNGTLPNAPPIASTVFVRVRGLAIGQAGIVPGETTSASLFDLARIWFGLDPAAQRHPFAVSIPKTESAEEALWWRDVFVALAAYRGLPHDTIKCIVIVESHPLAYQLEECAYALRDHVVALTLGRLDYLASLMHFTIGDPAWVLPDRHAIPHDIAFYQRLRELIVDISHKHGMLAIGGMTALFPDRTDAVRNARALNVLERDKRNEARMLMDGAWTGHPDQNAIALRAFPAPNQRFARRPTPRYPELRVPPADAGARTLAGTRAAVNAVLTYRFHVLGGTGAVRIDGNMEDMATERISRVMIAQRIRHAGRVPIDDGGRPIRHDRTLVGILFAQAERALVASYGAAATARAALARAISEECIFGETFDPA